MEEKTLKSPSMDMWDLEADAQKQIDKMREILNLPKITYKQAVCRQCGRSFRAQYIGIKKVTHRCGYSHNDIY